MDKKYTCVSLFSGAGGLDIGFSNAGFDVIWANDIDKDACNTHKLWSSATVVNKDISKIDISKIPDSDIVVGGFPCFTGETLVLMKDNSFKKISEIKIGDEISFNQKNYKVTNWWNQGFKKVIKLVMDDGFVVTCTPNHRFLCKGEDKNEWVEAKDLMIHFDNFQKSRFILKNDGSTTFVKEIIDISDKKEVFDIEVDDVHCFVLENDVIAHNCQGFSLAGPRKLDDKRNKLYRFYVSIVEEKKPKMFIAENVKGLLTLGDGEIIDAIVNDFSEKGYNVTYKLLDTSKYEVPQKRERVIIVGIRKDLDIEFNFPEGSDDIITIKQALKGVKTPKKGEVSLEPFSSRFMSRNRKRDWDELSFTIPAMSKQVPLHPSSPDMIYVEKDKWEFGEGKTRRFSYKECAALQTFPKDMDFYGDLISKYKQIGNAVPVKFAEAIAKEVFNTLEKIEED